MLFPWTFSGQRRILQEFVRSLFGGGVVQIRFPLFSKELVRNVDKIELPMELIEQQVGSWAGALLPRAQATLPFGTVEVWLLCVLHNLLYLCHPIARKMGWSYGLCHQWTQELIQQIPVSRTAGEAIVYHALLQRFEPFLDRARSYFDVYLELERLVSRSPLTALSWLDRLAGVQFDGLAVVLRNPDLARYSLHVIVGKEREVGQRHLPKVLEVIHRIVKLGQFDHGAASSLVHELNRLRERFSGKRAESE